MNCCDDYGNCNRGLNCPARAEPLNTCKHPRTMQEAFGPYVNNHIAEAEDPMDWQGLIIILGSAVVVVVFLALVVWGRACA